MTLAIQARLLESVVMSAYRKLALHVLKAALQDALEGDKQARAFLLEGTSFVFWCEVAGLDPSRARNAARLSLSTGRSELKRRANYGSQIAQVVS